MLAIEAAFVVSDPERKVLQKSRRKSTPGTDSFVIQITDIFGHLSVSRRQRVLQMDIMRVLRICLQFKKYVSFFVARRSQQYT